MTVTTATILTRLRDGMPCIDARGQACPIRDAQSGCDCAIAADTIERLRKATLTAATKFKEAAAHLERLEMPASAQVMKKFEREILAELAR